MGEMQHDSDRSQYSYRIGWKNSGLTLPCRKEFETRLLDIVISKMEASGGSDIEVANVHQESKSAKIVTLEFSGSLNRETLNRVMREAMLEAT